jgi:hypothetical protein
MQRLAQTPTTVFAFGSQAKKNNRSSTQAADYGTLMNVRERRGEKKMEKRKKNVTH